MGRSGLYVPLDAHYIEDPKMVGLSAQAELLFIRALCLCKRTKSDGFLDRRLLPGLLVRMKPRSDLPAELEAAELWEPVEDGWFIPSWPVHNSGSVNDPTNAERQRRSREKRNALRNAGPSVSNALREEKKRDTRNALRAVELEEPEPETPDMEREDAVKLARTRLRPSEAS